MSQKKTPILRSLSIPCHFILFIFIFAGSTLSFSQDISDSLSTKSYEYLFINFNKASSLKIKEAYMNEVVERSKKEKDTFSLTMGYFLKSKMYRDDRVLIYSDSIISITKNNSNSMHPAGSYFTKGKYYFTNKKLQKSLDNFLKAIDYSIKHGNSDLVFKSKYYLGIVKKQLGDKQDALHIFKENLEYCKKKDLKYDYMVSIYMIATIYYETNQLDLATEYNEIGLKEAVLQKNEKLKSYFKLNQAVINFLKGDFQSVEKTITAQIPVLSKYEAHENLAIAFAYLSKVKTLFKEEKQALIFLKKSDSIITRIDGIDQKFRDTYVQLVEYYKKKNKPQEQLKYLNKLIRLDSILHRNEVYLNRNLIKKYDIPKLISERELVIQQIREKNQTKKEYIIFLLILVVIIFSGFLYQLRKRSVYQKRFLAILNEDTKKNDGILSNKKNDTTQKINIPVETVNKILAGLQEFEKKQLYLKSDITLPFLAKEIDTNTKYLSKVISLNKKKSFTNYLNDLRVSYAIDKLKDENSFRKYTLLAIANEVGFRKTESFSKAFKKVTEITPAYFIKELSKN